MNEKSDLSLDEEIEGKSLSRREFLKLAGIAGASIGVMGGLGGLVAACGSGTTATTAAASTTTAAGVTTTVGATATSGPSTSVSAAASSLKVGMLVDYSFPLHKMWQDEMACLIPDLNAKGGLQIGGQGYTVDLITYDSKRDANTSRSAIQRLISNDKVSFIVADETVAYWEPLTEAANVLVCCECSSPQVVSPPNKMTFQASILNLLPNTVWGWFSDANPDVKTIAAAHPDNLGGHNEANVTANLAKLRGQTVVKEVFYPAGTTDFSAIATSLVNTKADVFITGAGGPVTDAAMFKAMHEANWKGKICLYVPYSLGQGSAIVSTDNFEGIYCPISATDQPTKTTLAQEMIDLYTAKKGKWDFPSVSYLNSWSLLKSALEQAATTDPAKVADFIHAGMEFDSPYGHAKMLPRPDLNNPLACDAMWVPTIGQILGGKYVIQKEMTVDEAYAIDAKAFGW